MSVGVRVLLEGGDVGDGAGGPDALAAHHRAPLEGPRREVEEREAARECLYVYI